MNTWSDGKRHRPAQPTLLRGTGFRFWPEEPVIHDGVRFFAEKRHWKSLPWDWPMTDHVIKVIEGPNACVQVVHRGDGAFYISYVCTSF